MKQFRWLIIPFGLAIAINVAGYRLWNGEYQAPMQEISMGLLLGLIPFFLSKVGLDAPFANDRAFHVAAMVSGVFFLISRLMTAAAYIWSSSPDLIFLLGAGLAGMTLVVLPVVYLLARRLMPDSQPTLRAIPLMMAGSVLIGCAGMAFAPILIWLPSVNCLIIPLLFVPGVLCIVIGYIVTMSEFNERIRRI